MLNRIFPEVSLGIGSSSKTADDEFKYESKASMFGRIGAGYNFFYKNGSPDFVIVQFRYGFSSSTASITNLIYQDGYWPDTQPKDIEDQKFNSHWIEFGAGLRVNVFKGLNMGWMVYYKPLLKAGTTQYANPWFIPGYGTRGNNFNFSFMVSYEIPLTKKQKTLVDPNAIF